MNWLEELRDYVEQYGTAPVYEAMPRLSLSDKGIGGPTAAHRIEETHTPFNLAYLTLTTGSTAFQNIVGVTPHELPDRMEAAREALLRCGLSREDELLVTYPPLVNVFPAKALLDYGLDWYFLKASSQDALILALCAWQAAGRLTHSPDVLPAQPRAHDVQAAPPSGTRAVLGESSFLRATLQSIERMGLLSKIPHGLVLITAGTPLDMELLPIAARIGATVHDLYGCQEFGWLVLDGVPLRADVALLPSPEKGLSDLIVGGLPTGDRFPVLPCGHALGAKGHILTYGRVRTAPDMEVTVLETTASSRSTVERLARTLLRIKARIVRVAPDCKEKAERTLLSIAPYGEEARAHTLCGPVETALFDTLLAAQMQYQATAKNDPAWSKER